jgi:hypothetical protein
VAESRFEFIGDYGGWGVDDNRETWKGVALIGYRWPAWGAHWTLQTGYRAMRWFDLEAKDLDMSLRVRGFTFLFGVEF